MDRIRIVLIVCAGLVATLGSSTAAAASDTVISSFDGARIVMRFYPAAGLQPGTRAPTVLSGPGYGFRGARTPDAAGGVRIGLGDLRRAGYNVLTWDPRGFGGSGGFSRFNSAAFEARDVQALIDYVARRPEALLDAPGDPRVGMVGSSYGGGIQFVTAAIEPRVDAIVPDIAWHSLATTFGRDGAVKAGWLTQLCLSGAGFGLLDGITDGLSGPAGIQTGSVDDNFLRVCQEAVALGRLSAASTQWLVDRGPGALVNRIRAPTLITQGTVDTLVTVSEAIANYAALREHGVPVKMMWYCGGHGTCRTPAGEPATLRRAVLTWLRRWLDRDSKADTGPRFEWIDDAGVWRKGGDYPLRAAGTLAASGGGSLMVLPTLTVTQGTTALSTPSLGMLELPYAPPVAEGHVVGAPTVTITYNGLAVPTSSFVFAQVADRATGRIVDDQVTPIPVVLDGQTRTITRKLEVIQAHARPISDLRLQITPSTPMYGPQRSAGTISLTSISSSLPLVDATYYRAGALAGRCWRPRKQVSRRHTQPLCPRQAARSRQTSTTSARR